MSAKTTKYILKCWERSVKKKSNTSFRVSKIHLLINIFLCMVKISIKTFLKILWWQFLVPHSEHLLVSSATLLCKTQNILNLSMLVPISCIMQTAFFWEVYHFYALTADLFQFINNQGFKWTSFWIFIVSCCSLILLLPNIVSSEELFRYGTSISRYV